MTRELALDEESSSGTEGFDWTQQTRSPYRTVVGAATVVLGLAVAGLLVFQATADGTSPLTPRAIDHLGQKYMSDGEHEGWSDSKKDQYIVDAFAADPAFLWGAASAAYQYEGSWNKDGRTPSIWDVFSHSPGRVYNNESGNTAVDFYNRYESDLKLLDSYGFNTFRLSISWSRVLPMGADGKRHANPDGIGFYKSLLASLKAKNITPMVTMYHWDLPEDLDWLSSNVIPQFIEYADFLWSTFPEVDRWITFNEPWSFCYLGYKLAAHAPGIAMPGARLRCGHNVLLAHAKAVDLFRRKYATPWSQIGITLNYDWAFPENPNNPHDVQAAEICHEMTLGWFADPVYLGDYPKVMRNALGDRLPKFTEQEKRLLKGSYIGFYGLNTYGGKWAYAPNNNSMHYKLTFHDIDGEPIGPSPIKVWLYKVPQAIHAHLHWVNNRYQPESIIITENGCADPERGEDALAQDVVHDSFRISYYRDYLSWVAQAKSEGVPVKGYTAWSLLDNFEWADGYKRRFGLTYVDYRTQERYPKDSSKWFKTVFSRLRENRAGAERYV